MPFPFVKAPSLTLCLVTSGCWLVSSQLYFPLPFAEDGRLFVWGGNEDGKLGLGEDLQNASMPEQLQFDHPVVCVACGYYHTAVVTGGYILS